MTNKSYSFTPNFVGVLRALRMQDKKYASNALLTEGFEEHTVSLYDEYMHFVGVTSFKGIHIGTFECISQDEDQEDFYYSFVMEEEPYEVYITDMGLVRVLRSHEGKVVEEQVWEASAYFDEKYVFKLFNYELGGEYIKVTCLNDFLRVIREETISKLQSEEMEHLSGFTLIKWLNSYNLAK